jgi:hypothetical protein
MPYTFLYIMYNNIYIYIYISYSKLLIVTWNNYDIIHCIG